MAKKGRMRIPKLRFTLVRDIGWYVAYRGRNTGKSRRHRFGISEKECEREARILYHAWVLKHLGGNEEAPYPTQARLPIRHKAQENVLSGSLLEIASALIQSERSRARSGGEPRRKGTIAAPVFRDRKKQIRDFLEFMNSRYGSGAVAKLRLADLSIEDIEAYNRKIVKDGYSASQVSKRIQPNSDQVTPDSSPRPTPKIVPAYVNSIGNHRTAIAASRTPEYI